MIGDETLLQKDKITRFEIFDDFQEIHRDEFDCTVQFYRKKNSFLKEKESKIKLSACKEYRYFPKYCKLHNVLQYAHLL